MNVDRLSLAAFAPSCVRQVVSLPCGHIVKERTREGREISLQDREEL